MSPRAPHLRQVLSYGFGGQVVPMQMVVVPEFEMPRAANCSSPGGSGKPAKVAVAVASRWVPLECSLTMNRPVLECELYTLRVIGPWPVQVTFTPIVVSLQLIGLPPASTVQVVAGRPEPLRPALASVAWSMVNEKPLVSPSAKVSVPPVTLPFSSRWLVNCSAYSTEPCFDADTLTKVLVLLVAELLDQSADANPP